MDFSLPAATREIIDATTASGTPLVCGVTGLGEDLMAAISGAAETVPVVYDRNMSLGIAVLESIAVQAARALGEEFEVEVHETHHVHKVDAPSGTALKLGEAVAAARGEDPASMHYESERRGEVPGDHTVVFSSASERLRLWSNLGWLETEFTEFINSEGEDLSGREIVVRASSSYFESLAQENRRLETAGLEPMIVTPAHEVFEAEDLLEMVAAGVIDITVCDDYVARFWKQVYPDLRVHEDLALREGGVQVAGGAGGDRKGRDQRVAGSPTARRTGRAAAPARSPGSPAARSPPPCADRCRNAPPA